MTTDRTTGYNIVLAIGGLNGFLSTEVHNSTFVLRLNFSANFPSHRQYANRYLYCNDNLQTLFCSYFDRWLFRVFDIRRAYKCKDVHCLIL